jgi:exosortase
MVRSRVLTILENRHWVFLLSGFLICFVFWLPLRDMVALALRDQRYTYILVVPIISAGLFFAEKKHRSQGATYRLGIGLPLALVGLAALASRKLWLSTSVNMSIPIAGLVLMLIGLYISCYGTISFRHATFPLLLLFFMVPVPTIVLDKAVTLLQTGSSEVSYRLFRLVGIPVLRHGTIMSLPGLDIEVAPQCSGIRSTMALFLAGVALGDITLRSGWGKLLVVLCIGPIGILRNAIRIVAITLLGVYVNKNFLYGNLHRNGGLVFALVGFAILLAIVWLLRNCELWCRHRLSGPASNGVRRHSFGG